MTSFNDILEEIGSWGRYQKRVFYLFLLPLTICLAFRMSFIFTLAVPDHYCHVPVREELNITQEKWNDIILPKSGFNYESCQKYDINISSIEDLSKLSPTNMSFYNLTGCTEQEWIYDQTHYQQTVISANHWVCDKLSYATIIMTVGQIAGLIGSLLFGYLADNVIGRKPACYIQIIPVMIGSIGLLFQPPFWLYCVFHALSMTVFPSLFQVMFILLAEQVDDSKRVILNGISFVVWTLGMCVLALISWLVQGYWFYLMLIETLCYIPLIFTYPIVYESPRWLLIVGKLEKAAEECQKIAKANGKTVSKDLVKILESINEANPSSNLGIKGLCSSKILAIRGAIIIFIWMSVGLAYGGVQLNIGNLGGNPYLNFFYMSSVELASLFLGMIGMEKLGRRVSQIISMFGFCVACWAYVIVPLGSPDSTYIVISVIAKMCVTASFFVIYQQAVEIFPTVLRSVGMAMGAVFSGLAGLFTPSIIYSATQWYPLPFVIFGVLGTISLIISPFIPETYNKSLAETIKDADLFGRDQKFFSLNIHQTDSIQDQYASVPQNDKQEKEMVVIK